MSTKSDEMRNKIRKCVEASGDANAAREALSKMGVKVLSLHIGPATSTNGIKLANGRAVSLIVEAFVPQEFVPDAGASGMVPAGWKTFQF